MIARQFPPTHSVRCSARPEPDRPGLSVRPPVRLGRPRPDAPRRVQLSRDLSGTHQYQYDALYRLTQVTYPGPQTDAYTYDAVGNRLTKNATAYTYDNADEMLTAGGVSYGYDANGNQTSRGTDTFAYDHENRLTQSVIAGVSGTYIYSGDGLRVSRNIGGTSVSYTWDVVAGLPVILQDSPGNTYVYGIDLISRTDSGGIQEYYLYDGLGSTSDLANGAGNTVASYQYDVFGSLRAQTGSSANEFKFTGEQVDSSGLQYLRARYYDPASGRFLRHDPAPAPIFRPAANNAYAYVANNPTSWVDPSGLWCPKNPKDCIPKPAKDAAECVKNKGSCVTKPIRDVVDALKYGYVDVNVSSILPWPPFLPCLTLTGGVQVSFKGGFKLHPYGGAGCGFPPTIIPTLSVTTAPGQAITTGVSCGVQGSAISQWFVGVTAQGGVSGILKDKEGDTPFAEGGVAVGRPGFSIAGTCYYIGPDIWPW